MPIENGVSVHSKGGVMPRQTYETTVAEIVDRSSGRIEVIEILKSNISNVKSTPASGALKIPATAPDAPQPRRIVIFL